MYFRCLVLQQWGCEIHGSVDVGAVTFYCGEVGVEIIDPYLREDETVNSTHPPTHELDKGFHYARHCCMHGTEGPCVAGFSRGGARATRTVPAHVWTD